MRLLACLMLTTLVASALTQEFPSAQIEAVHSLPNVDVQVMNDGSMFRAGDVPMEVETDDSAVDPSAVIVDAVSDAVETVAASLSQDVPEGEDEAVVVEEAVQEDPAPTLEVEEDEVVVDEEAVQEDPAPTREVEEDEVVVDEEAVQEDPAPTREVVEEETAEVDETLPEEDEPMLQAVAAETVAPEPAVVDDIEPTLDIDTSMMTVSEPEPEPVPEDNKEDEKFAVEEPVPAVPMKEEVLEVGEPRKPTKKELKAIEKYNAAVDNIAKILSRRLRQRDALPLDLDEEVLERLEEEVTTLPPTTLPPTTPAPEPTAAPTEAECPERLMVKCASDKCKKKEKCMSKCKAKGCLKKKKKNKSKKKIKNQNRKGDDKNKKNKNKNNNNKKQNNKNKRKTQNKRIRNKLFRPRGIDSHRQSKDLDLDEARRKGNDENKTKNKKGRKGGNKKKNNNRNKSRLEELEAEPKVAYVAKSAEEGPLFASNEELFGASAVIMAFSNIRREGNVEVDLSGRFTKFVATVVMGPLNVRLTDPASPLKRSQVITELTVDMHFTAKQVRNREKLKINEVVVDVPEDENISVLRSDLDLDRDVISAAQEEVSSAIDTERVARIIHSELDAAFDEDNILQNLEEHPSLKA